MAINFPHNPNVNDVHTESSLGKSWKWDGTTWLIYSSSTTGIGWNDLSVVTEAAVSGGSLTYNNLNGQFTFKPSTGGGGGGSSTFTGLGDTPSSLTAGKWLKVNVGGTALEWTDAPTGNDTNDYLNTASLSGTTLTLTRTGSQSLSDVTVDLSSLNSVPTTITVADESTETVCYPLFTTAATGNLAPKTGSNIKFNSASGQLEAGSFKKTGGAAAEFLKADGSIDSNTYSQSNHTHSYALNDLSNVDATTNLANGKILKYDLGSTTWVVADDNASGGGSSSFTGLSDTPSAHSNDKWLKSNGSALVWADAPTDTNTQLSTEDVQDIVGGMVVGNTESGITVQYSDSAAKLNFTVTGSGATPTLDDVLTAGNTSTSSIEVGNATVGVLNVTANDIILNSDFSGSSPSANVSLKVERGNSADVSIRWNETTDTWQYTNDGSSFSDITGGDDTLDTVTGRGATTSNDVTVGNFICSNLTVNGTTTTVNSNTVNIGDNILRLNSDEAGTPSQNGGIEIERGTSANVAIRWNETTDKWEYTNDGSTYQDITDTNTDTNTTYDLLVPSSTTAISLDPSSGTADNVTITGGTNVTVTRTSGTELTISSTDTNTTYSSFTGTTPGLVPDGTSAGSTKFLKSDGSWGDASITESDTLATVTARGSSTTTACTFQNLNIDGSLVTGALSVTDPQIWLNSDLGSSQPTENVAIKVNRGNASDVEIRWDESGDKWQATNDGSNYYDVGGGVPAGTIVMYNGTTAPEGWALCDGGAGRPNLVDKFVVGAGSSYNVGANAGSADAVVVSHNHGSTGNQSANHTHGPGNSMATNFTGEHYHQLWSGNSNTLSGSGTTGSQSANHYHTIGGNKPDGSAGTWTANTSGGDHIHGIQTSSWDNQSDYSGPYIQGGSDAGNWNTRSGQGSHNHSINLTGITTGGVDQNHTHNFNFNVSGNTTNSSSGNHGHNINGNTGSQSANHTHNISSEGVSGTGKNLPPYYALTYIIKL